LQGLQLLDVADVDGAHVVVNGRKKDDHPGAEGTWRDSAPITAVMR